MNGSISTITRQQIAKIIIFAQRNKKFTNSGTFSKQSQFITVTIATCLDGTPEELFRSNQLRWRIVTAQVSLCRVANSYALDAIY